MGRASVLVIHNLSVMHKHPSNCSDPLSCKAQRLEHNLRGLLDTYGQGEFPVKEMAEKLMRDTVKDEESKLPGIYPPEMEYNLSSIFVEEETPKVK